uniref:Uncharacterized protein n=1 Tax=Zea mays TaxID=4577 RepID=B4FJM3_MAIZE|nr:unknown [Zea mays]
MSCSLATCDAAAGCCASGIRWSHGDAWGTAAGSWSWYGCAEANCCDMMPIPVANSAVQASSIGCGISWWPPGPPRIPAYCGAGYWCCHAAAGACCIIVSRSCSLAPPAAASQYCPISVFWMICCFLFLESSAISNNSCSCRISWDSSAGWPCPRMMPCSFSASCVTRCCCSPVVAPQPPSSL